MQPSQKRSSCPRTQTHKIWLCLNCHRFWGLWLSNSYLSHRKSLILMCWAQLSAFAFNTMWCHWHYSRLDSETPFWFWILLLLLSSFLPPHKELLSEWKKEALSPCQGLLANTIAYQGQLQIARTMCMAVTDTPQTSQGTDGPALFGDPGQRYGSLEERRSAESSKLCGQLCVQTSTESQQAETAGCSAT